MPKVTYTDIFHECKGNSNKLLLVKLLNLALKKITIRLLTVTSKVVQNTSKVKMSINPFWCQSIRLNSH